MNNSILNDILECPVCLEKFNHFNKVLPCQHTFCTKCLKEIVRKNKELRCPECRVVFNTKVHDLPPNVLLMLIFRRIPSSFLCVSLFFLRVHIYSTH